MKTRTENKILGFKNKNIPKVGAVVGIRAPPTVTIQQKMSDFFTMSDRFTIIN